MRALNVEGEGADIVEALEADGVRGRGVEDEVAMTNEGEGRKFWMRLGGF